MSAYEEHDDVVATKAWDSAVLRRLGGFVRPHARLFAASFGVLVGVFLLELASPWILTHAIDGPVRAARAARDADPAADVAPWLRELAWWAAAYLGAGLLAGVFRYWELAFLTLTGQNVIHDLRTRLFRHMQGLDLAWFDRHPTGALVTRVTSDIENLNELFTSGLVVLAFDLLRVLVVLVLLFLVSAPLAALVLLLTPVLIGASLVFRGGARRAHRDVRARLARLNGFLQEVLSGMRVVHAFRREERVAARFADNLAAYLRANFRTIFLFALFYPTVAFVVTGIQGATLWRGGDAIAAGHLSAADFLLFWFWLQLLVGPIRELGERYNVLQSAFASAERIFSILDTRPTITSPPEPRALPRPLRGHVRFEGIGFSYRGAAGTRVLRDVSIEIPAGQTVALVGATGSGKSTLVSLLLRFYDPLAGRVTVDGVDLREVDLEQYRARVGLVLQEDFVFSGSVRQNLVLGRDGIDDAALERALAASSAASVVARIEGGLDGQLSERGSSLSTGERELLAIARALAGDPALVILDEATSSVDSATEARIEAATRALLRGRSALVVAHRLSTVRRADRIYVLHKGEVREFGTHESLLARGGLYARLHRMQFDAEGEPATSAARTP